MFQIITLIVGVVATVVGVAGKTTHERKKFPKNLTRLGWAMISLAVISALISGMIQYQDKIEKDKVTFWAMRELEFATYKMLGPYIKITDPPEEEDRYKYTKSLIEAGVFESFAEISLSDTATMNDHVTYAQLATRDTENACGRMSEILSRYSAFLSSETVELITDLRTDSWTEMMLSAADNYRDRPMRKRSSQFQKVYVEKAKAFSLKLQKLEEHIGLTMTTVCEELGRENPAPAFLLPLNR